MERKNRITRVVLLHLANDLTLYRRTKTAIVKDNLESTAWNIKEVVEEAIDFNVTGDPPSLLMHDLAMQALSQVCWEEIAEYFLEQEGEE